MEFTESHATFPSFDGTIIAYREIGEGRPTLMLHGFLADAKLNWIEPGIAAALLPGRRLILPDLRAHGASAAPEDPAAYPKDVLAIDQEALLEHLGIGEFDLVGYSLGARTAIRVMARGARPRRAVIGGLGDSGAADPEPRAIAFRDWLSRGEAAENAEAGRVVQAMMEQRGLSRTAMVAVCDSWLATPPEALAQIDVPILVVSGARDEDNGSAEGLAALLPRARALRTPGSHLSAVAKPEFTAAIADFLGEGAA